MRIGFHLVTRSVALAAVAAAAMLLRPAAAAFTPTAEEIIQRILTTVNRSTPDLASVDARFRFRYKKPVTAPPDCVFEGTIRFERDRRTLALGRRTAGLACWVVDRFVLGRLFESREPLESFLSRFEFEVLGLRLVDGHPYYLIQGRARDPRNNPRGLLGWVDYDLGLVPEGTVEYTWGTIDTEQKYAQVEGAWVLTYQYLYTPRFDASLEVVYSNFRFASH